MNSKNIFLLGGFLLMIVALSFLSGCGGDQSISARDQAVINAVAPNDPVLFDPGSSDTPNLSAQSTTPGTMPFVWYRTVSVVGHPSVTILSNEGSTAVAQVTKMVTGVLNLKLVSGSFLAMKYFSDDYSRYVELTSSNDGITWTRSQLTPGLTRSVAASASVASDVTINEVVIKDNTAASGEVTLYDVIGDASASGPWSAFPPPMVTPGDTLEVFVYASRANDTVAPWVYVWPGISTIFRRPLYDDGTHGDASSGDGLYVNTSQPLSVPAGETPGLKTIHIGVFSDATLADNTSPYDLTGWHFLYQVQ